MFMVVLVLFCYSFYTGAEDGLLGIETCSLAIVDGNMQFYYRVV